MVFYPYCPPDNGLTTDRVTFKTYLLLQSYLAVLDATVEKEQIGFAFQGTTNFYPLRSLTRVSVYTSHSRYGRKGVPRVTLYFSGEEMKLASDEYTTPEQIHAFAAGFVGAQH